MLRAARALPGGHSRIPPSPPNASIASAPAPARCHGQSTGSRAGTRRRPARAAKAPVSRVHAIGRGRRRVERRGRASGPRFRSRPIARAEIVREARDAPIAPAGATRSPGRRTPPRSPARGRSTAVRYAALHIQVRPCVNLWCEPNRLALSAPLLNRPAEQGHAPMTVPAASAGARGASRSSSVSPICLRASTQRSARPAITARPRGRHPSRRSRSATSRRPSSSWKAIAATARSQRKPARGGASQARARSPARPSRGQREPVGDEDERPPEAITAPVAATPRRRPRAHHGSQEGWEREHLDERERRRIAERPLGAPPTLDPLRERQGIERG